MALYSYQALTKTGKKVTGALDAPSLSVARDVLTSRDLYPIKITLAATVEESDSWFTSFKKLFKRRISIKDKIFFTKQLAILLRAGVPLLDALSLLSEQTTGGLKKIIIDVRDTIKEGKTLADGLAKYPKIFEKIYIQLVRAGEASGRLEIILERLTHYLIRQQELRKKVKGALMYPAIQLVIILGVVIILLTYVVPEIAQVFEGQNAALPANTRFLLALSSILTNHYLVLLGVFISLFVGYRLWKSTASGARAIDALKLKLPVIKYFTRMNAVVQFSSTLGMLTEAGVNLAESLTIVTNIVENKVLVDTLNAARENIIKQGRIAEYLKQTDIFPPMAIYLIHTGEQSGQLDTMLLTVAENYENELKELADSLTTTLEPALLIFMAVIVGFIVLSIVTPLVQLNQLAGQM